MISAGELRPGATFERDGQLYQVMDFAHVKQARGSAFVRTKFKNLYTGSLTEETFRPEERFMRARIERTEAQFLYRDGDLYTMMDTTTYDQSTVSAQQLGESVHFLKENENMTLLKYVGRVIGIELPIAVELKVTETEPGFKGDTANAASKPAKLETGWTVDVPLFVNQGELVRVDTRTGKYMERVS